MRRVVITGLGIVSSIGNDAEEVAALAEGRAARASASRPTMPSTASAARCTASRDIDVAEHIDKRQLRFMGDGAAFAFLAMQQAIADAGLEESDVSNERTGLIVGLGRAVDQEPVRGAPHGDREGQPEADGAVHGDPLHVLDGLGLPRDAVPDQGHQLLDHLGLLDLRALHRRGVEQIQWGKQDIVFAGGGEELDWTLSCLFDAMGAMSTKYNDTPETASRAFDANRDGFVIAGGGGMVVLEELEHALARGAKIYAEVTGYGATSDGYDMVAPSGEGGERACGWRSPRSATAGSATSTRTAPRRRSATSARSRRSAGCSARATRRRSARPSR